MMGHSALDIFTVEEMDLHRAATTMVAGLPHLPWVRCHELTRAIAIRLRGSPHRFEVVDGKFGIASHSWLTLKQPFRHIILDVYSVGSVPMVQLHDALTVSVRGARAYVEGPTRDDIDQMSIETLLNYLE